MNWSLWIESKMLALGCYTIPELARELGVPYPTVYTWIYGCKGNRVMPNYRNIVKLKKMFPNDDWDWILKEE